MTFGKTGEKCLVTGKYRCFGTINESIYLKAGQHFPGVYDSILSFWIFLNKTEDHNNNNAAEPSEKKF